MGASLFGYRCRRVSSPAAAFLIVGLAFGVTPCASLAQTNLITNGNFESGTFNGFTVANVRDPTDTNSAANFYIDKPGTTTPPIDGFFFNTAPNALPGSGGGGNFYAVTANNLPGESALLQTFTVPNFPGNAPLRVIFSFDAFVNDQTGYSDTLTDGTSLDYTTGGSFMDNQYARVDLLTSSAADFSTSASDVLLNVPLNVPMNDDPNTNPNPYQRYSVDISSKVVRGGTYKIRFAEVNNLSALNLGVDNVSVTTELLPEPSTISLLAFAPALLLVRLRRRHNRREAQA